MGLNGAMGLSGLIPLVLALGLPSCTTARLFVTVEEVAFEESEELLLEVDIEFPLEFPLMIWILPLASTLTLEGLLLSELLTAPSRSSWLSAAVLLRLGGGRSPSISATSISVYFSSVLQPCQQARQLQTRNLKQKASIFMQGWKQMHRLR